MKKTAELARRQLLELLSNPGVFVLAAFTVSGMFTPGKLGEYRGLIERSVIIPWGLALSLLRLYRADAQGGVRGDVCALFALLGWLVVPFAMRFGPTDANMNSWVNHTIIFFGVYAMVTQTDAQQLDRQLRVTTALFACVTLVYAGVLLYCAATVRNFGYQQGEFGYGVYLYAQLCAGQHYNATGMLAMCCMMMCLMGAARGKSRMERALYLIVTVMAALVVILSQSRTARYSMLIALAAGAYAVVAAGKWHGRALVRQAAGLLVGAVALVGGYMAASGITDAALLHYARARVEQQTLSLIPAAQADSEQDGEEAPLVVEQARGIGEGTLTGRTDVWKNIFRMWKDNPKYFLIGNGVGRTSRDILIGTPLEHGGANMAHNGYIQFAMDYGLIGFALLAAFIALILAPVLRVFYAGTGTAQAGSRVMCMLAIACALTCMLENEPLAAMRPCNVVLFYALGVIVHAGLTMRKRA